MEILGFLWNDVLIRTILNLLVVFYKIFSSIGLPGSLGFAIIGLTILIRFILYPFTAAQMRSIKKMQELKPHMDRIKEVHKKDTMRQQQEMAKLYKEHGINPAAGCLPLLIQMPVFIALYNVLLQVVSNGDIAKVVSDINKIVYFPFLRIDTPWDPYFFGINLAAKPSDWQTAGVFLLAVPVITAVLQFLQTKMMSPTPTPQQALVKKDTNEKKDDMADFSNVMQKQMLYFFPVMIGFFSYGFPVGLSLYWNAFTLFGIIQQYFISHRDTRSEAM